MRFPNIALTSWQRLAGLLTLLAIVLAACNNGQGGSGY
jgi:predicted small secreted protein